MSYKRLEDKDWGVRSAPDVTWSRDKEVMSIRTKPRVSQAHSSGVRILLGCLR